MSTSTLGGDGVALVRIIHPNLPGTTPAIATMDAFTRIYEPLGWIRSDDAMLILPGEGGTIPSTPATSGSGTTDHAVLTNLATGDPHPQYTTRTHAARHATNGTDPVDPAGIGAATSGHTHAAGALTAHAPAHAPAGADPLSAAVLGAADAAHTHVLADGDIPGSIARDSEVTAAINGHGHGSTYASATHATQHASGGVDPVTPAGIGAATTGHSHGAAAPAAHAASHATGQADAIAAAAIGAATSGHTHTLVDADIPAAIARDAEVTTAISTHAAQADPHPTYATDTDLSNHAGAADPHAVYATDTDLTNHAAAGDPHPVYLTSAEGNAAYATTGHTHAGLTTAKLAADVSSSVITMGDVTGLSLTLAANTAYGFEFIIGFSAAATTTGIKLAVNGPATPTYVSYTVETPLTATSDTLNAVNAYDAGAVTTGVAVAATVYTARIHGVIRTAAAGGPLVARFASEVAASAVTVKAGSWGVLI